MAFSSALIWNGSDENKSAADLYDLFAKSIHESTVASIPKKKGRNSRKTVPAKTLELIQEKREKSQESRAEASEEACTETAGALAFQRDFQPQLR